MRAGSLSDSRTVAILKKYFIPVMVTELSTKDLLPKEDVALVEKYDKQLRAERRGSLHGGVSEGMFLPDGTLYQFYAALYTPDWNAGYLRGESMDPKDRPETNQYVKGGREHKNGPVRVFFRAANRTLKKVHGKRPDDWKDLLGDKAPEVAEVEKQTLVEPGDHAKTPVLRVWTRSSHSYYDALVGAEIVQLADKSLKALTALVTNTPRQGGQAWLDKSLCLQIAKAMIPRGGVLVQLKDESISCKIGATVETVMLSEDQQLVMGRLNGEFVLEPRTAIERGRRATCQAKFKSAGKLLGYFAYDVKKKVFTELKIVSQDVSFRHDSVPPNRKDPFVHHIGIELLRPGMQ